MPNTGTIKTPLSLARMVDLGKYKYNPYSLTKGALASLKKLIEKEGLTRAIDFGSGVSSYFLHDMGMDFVAFDDSPLYAAQLPEVKIRELVQLSDEQFEWVINGLDSYIAMCATLPTINGRSTRQKNCFYRLKLNDLVGYYDLVILDGCNGNGRSIAFNAIDCHLSDKAFIFIDDYHHYPFAEHLKLLFPQAELIEQSQRSRRQMFEIYKIIQE